MPRRYKKKQYKRKTYRKKRVSSQLSPMVNRFATKLKYVDQSIQLDPGIGGTAAVQVFSGNGLYDPNITLTGHQPRGFDQIMAMYDHCVSIGSKIKVTAYNEETNVSVIFGVAVMDTPNVSADVNDYLESGRVMYKIISKISNGDPTTVYARGSPKKILGISHPLASPELKNSTSSNPTEQFYYHVFVAPQDGSTNAGVTTITAELEYLTVFIEPKIPTQS